MLLPELAAGEHVSILSLVPAEAHAQHPTAYAAEKPALLACEHVPVRDPAETQDEFKLKSTGH